uniref:Uncharacterized protein n=1 Tax=Auxenochlorella protothecoides TaxID=3075 RepID=A0A1D2A2X9_AUXPR
MPRCCCRAEPCPSCLISGLETPGPRTVYSLRAPSRRRRRRFIARTGGSRGQGRGCRPPPPRRRPVQVVLTQRRRHLLQRGLKVRRADPPLRPVLAHRSQRRLATHLRQLGARVALGARRQGPQVHARRQRHAAGVDAQHGLPPLQANSTTGRGAPPQHGCVDGGGTVGGAQDQHPPGGLQPVHLGEEGGQQPGRGVLRLLALAAAPCAWPRRKAALGRGHGVGSRVRTEGQHLHAFCAGANIALPMNRPPADGPSTPASLAQITTHDSHKRCPTTTSTPHTHEHVHLVQEKDGRGCQAGPLESAAQDGLALAHVLAEELGHAERDKGGPGGGGHGPGQGGFAAAGGTVQKDAAWGDQAQPLEGWRPLQRPLHRLPGVCAGQA